VLSGGAKIADAAAESIASAAAARLLQQMEAALEAESDRLQGWLGKLESIAELRMKVGKVIGFSQDERKVLNSGQLEAMMVAEQTANAIASAACSTD
jgi:gamma-glutamyl phosphate reductase